MGKWRVWFGRENAKDSSPPVYYTEQRRRRGWINATFEAKQMKHGKSNLVDLPIDRWIRPDIDYYHARSRRNR